MESTLSNILSVPEELPAINTPNVSELVAAKVKQRFQEVRDLANEVLRLKATIADAYANNELPQIISFHRAFAQLHQLMKSFQEDVTALQDIWIIREKSLTIERDLVPSEVLANHEAQSQEIDAIQAEFNALKNKCCPVK